MLNFETLNGRLLIVSSILVTIIFYGYSFICLMGIGACVFFLTLNFLNDPNSQPWLTNLLLERFELLPSDSPKLKNESKKVVPFSQEFPWHDINLPVSLNLALEHFANSLIEDYINKWYKAEISADNNFLLEIRYQIRYGSSTAIKALHNFNFAELIQNELLPIVVLHANRISNLLDSNDEGNVDDQLKNAFSEDLHVAMQSAENAEHYLSEISDHLVARLMDDSRIGGRELDAETPKTYMTMNWPSETCRHFLRQLVLSTILNPLLDFITNPDTLNRLVTIALDPNKAGLEDISKEERVTFLENISKYSHSDVPDSLLVLKLSDLIRDPRLLQIFDVYLRDTQGPTHWLDCFLQTNDCLHRLQAINGSDNSDFNEVFSDAWQLYSAFVHQSAKAQIELFSEQLVNFFSNAIEEKSHTGLVKCVEDIYMILYHELNYNHVVPFCQSESYLGYLCGTSAGAEELFQEEERKKSMSDISQPSSSLSITQIPTKIWNVLRGDFGGEEIEEERKEVASIDIEPKFIEEKVGEDQIEDEFKPIDTIDSSFLEIDDFNFNQTIDMNLWKVSVPIIERRRRFRSGKIYFTYIVTIERNDDKFDQSTSQCCSITPKIDNNSQPSRPPLFDDLDYDDDEDLLERQIEEYEAMSQLPKAWSIARTYDEFYVFDKSLRTHFGSDAQPFALLPDRKMMCQRSQKFLESQRQYMEAFLQRLTRQSLLKHSELFFAFLTNPGESGFETSLITNDDLNSQNSVNQRRRESESESGEFLKPFISRLLAKALTNEDTYMPGVPEEQIKFDTNSLDSGTYSFIPDTNSEDGQFVSKMSNLSKDGQTSEIVENFNNLSGNISSFSARLFNSILQPNEYFKLFALTLIDLFSDVLNRLFGRELKNTMDTVLDETTILHIVKALHEVVFDEKHEEISQEEIQKRAEEAEKLLVDWLSPKILPRVSQTASNRLQQSIHRIFNCFQNATLNRQLAFVLVDKLTRHILPPDPEKILSQLHSELGKSAT